MYEQATAPGNLGQLNRRSPIFSRIFTVFYSNLANQPSPSVHIPVTEQKPSDDDRSFCAEDVDLEIGVEAQKAIDLGTSVDGQLILDSPLPEFPNPYSLLEPQTDHADHENLEGPVELSSVRSEPQSDDKKKEELTLRPLPREPYTSAELKDSLSFPSCYFKNSLYCVGESSRSGSFPRGMYENQSSFSSCTSTTSTTSTITTSTGSQLSSSSKVGLGLLNEQEEHYPQISQVLHQKPVSPIENLPNSTIAITNNYNFQLPADVNQSPNEVHKLEQEKLGYAPTFALLAALLLLHFSKPKIYDWSTTKILGLSLMFGFTAVLIGNSVQNYLPNLARWIRKLSTVLVAGPFYGIIARFLWPRMPLFLIPLVTFAFLLFVLPALKAFRKPCTTRPS